MLGRFVSICILLVVGSNNLAAQHAAVRLHPSSGPATQLDLLQIESASQTNHCNDSEPTEEMSCCEDGDSCADMGCCAQGANPMGSPVARICCESFCNHSKGDSLAFQLASSTQAPQLTQSTDFFDILALRSLISSAEAARNITDLPLRHYNP